MIQSNDFLLFLCTFVGCLRRLKDLEFFVWFWTKELGILLLLRVIWSFDFEGSKFKLFWDLVVACPIWTLEEKLFLQLKAWNSENLLNVVSSFLKGYLCNWYYEEYFLFFILQVSLLKINYNVFWLPHFNNVWFLVYVPQHNVSVFPLKQCMR